MTNQQIEYSKLLENMRANREQEAIEREKMRRSYLLSARELSEKERHNLATEAETARYEIGTLAAKGQEIDLRGRELALSSQSLEETKRTHLANEALTKAAQSETARHNLEAEALASRESQLNERRIEYQHAENMANVSARYAELAEQTRHAKIVEAESERHNKEVELETQYRDAEELYYKKQATESDVQTNQSLIEYRDTSTAETERHNRRMEELQRASTAWDITSGIFNDASRFASTIMYHR